jgi:uncharacterized protein YndB with AHSA1/START domain
MSKIEQVYTSYIRSTPEKVWAAITNPEFARQYWGGNANISGWKKGDSWHHEGSANAIFVEGKVLESTPPKRLVLSWAEPDKKTDESQVAFDITVVHDMVRLDVVHSKLSDYMNGKISQGWPLVLSSLKSLLETGKAIDIIAIKGSCGKAA